MAIETPDTEPDERYGRILVADDDAMNRTMLADSLEARGFFVKHAVDGEAALRLASEWSPDVLLLDVMMPKLDGFEVCRRMKQNSDLASIPVIMITALEKRRERLIGIEAGANDFLVKPIDLADTLLRVRNAVREKHLHDKLKRNYTKLQQLEVLRDDLTSMIIHDMRTPLMVIQGYLDIWETAQENTNGATRNTFVPQIRAAMVTLTHMVSNLLDTSRIESGEMPLTPAPFNAGEQILEIAERLRFLIRDRSCEVDLPDEPLIVEADGDLLTRVIENLLINACKFTPPDGSIAISANVAGGALQVEVSDTGPGVPDEDRESIFNKFSQVDATRKSNSSGLGLTFCKLAVERHGGTIGVSNRPGGGSRFWFKVPAK